VPASEAVQQFAGDPPVVGVARATLVRERMPIIAFDRGKEQKNVFSGLAASCAMSGTLRAIEIGIAIGIDRLNHSLRHWYSLQTK